MRIFLVGGTGLIGTRLLWTLRSRGDEVVLLTRRPEVARDQFGTACEIVQGDGTSAGPWMEAVASCDAAINLAGESIFSRRWNPEFLKVLHDSRILTTNHVVQALAKKPTRDDGQPRILVNASAIGYYGPRGDERLGEDATPGHDTMAKLVVDWESAAAEGEKHGLRVSMLRIGVVLDRAGGALGQMLTPFKLGVGGPIGSGSQWMSWIHHVDVVGLLLLALDNDNAVGPMNGTAPEPATNKEFSKALGRALSRPAFLPVPGFALKLRFGQVADILTTGQRVVPAKALALGYKFRFPNLDEALRDAIADQRTAQPAAAVSG